MKTKFEDFDELNENKERLVSGDYDILNKSKSYSYMKNGYKPFIIKDGKMIPAKDILKKKPGGIFQVFFLSDEEIEKTNKIVEKLDEMRKSYEECIKSLHELLPSLIYHKILTKELGQDE